MALTAEQQAQIEFETALNASRAATNIQHTKMELVRLAKDVLIENDRSKPADERGVTASEITAYANELLTYVNQ